MSQRVHAHPDGPPGDRTNLTGFGRWLKMKTGQETPLGSLARTIMVDEFWPDPQSRADLLAHLRALGVRGFVLQIASDAWSEYESWIAKGIGKERARARGKRAKKARQKNRAVAGKKRKR